MRSSSIFGGCLFSSLLTGGPCGGEDHGGANKSGASSSDRLIELAHLSSAVGHYLINAYSATVSNAELIRSPLSRSTDAEGTGSACELDHRDGATCRERGAEADRSGAKRGVLELYEANGEPRTSI